MNGFEQQLNSLILLKALLIRNGEGEFDEVAKREYREAWNRAFELLKQKKQQVIQFTLLLFYIDVWYYFIEQGGI